MAILAEGDFDVVDRQIHLLDGPPLTRAILAQIQEIAQRAQSQEITPKEAITAAKQVDPRLAVILERFLAVGLAALAAFLAFLSWQIQSASFERQQEDNAASAEFYRDALKLLERQTLAMETPQDSSGVNTKSDHPPTVKPYKKPTTTKGSKRRRAVNKARREELKRRRMAFPRRPHN